MSARPYRWQLPGLLLAVVLPACGPSGYDDALTVATSWPRADRERWETAARQVSNSLAPVRWRILAEGDEPTRLATLNDPPDLLLGVSPSVCRELERRGLVEKSSEGKPAWRVVRSRALGVLGAPDLLTIDDPRHDAVSLAWAATTLESNPWAEGYAQLVRAVRGERPPGPRSGSAQAAVAQGQAPGAPVFVSERSSESGKEVAQGVKFTLVAEAIVALGRAWHAREAASLVAALPEGPDPDRPADPRVIPPLLADLLGSTLVDAHDELVDGWKVLVAAGKPERMVRFMTEPPPWPPASVAKLLGQGEGGLELVETLAAQLAPDADVRATLIRSWLAEPRQVDGTLLTELSSADDGRLAREPRFHAWLRAEWTAWARQRYRRVARQTLAGPREPGGQE